MRTQSSFRAVLGAAVLLLAIGVVVLLVTQKSEAIPPFARKYHTSCTTCHIDFPKLNDFGKAFKDAGFKFPSDDESFIKTPPVMLGADAQKQMFPHVVWPGTIPGMPPIGLRMNNFFQVVGRNRNNYNTLTPAGSIPAFIPQTDFQSGLFSMFTAGNFGSDIAFWVDDDISIAGDNGNGGLGDGYLKFVNLGRLVKLPKDSLSVRAGQFELDLPFTQARSINLSPYDIYTQANFGSVDPAFAVQNVNNAFTMADPGRGIEISGGHTYGGYHYSFAVVDQNTSGAGPNASPYVPSANGVGFSSDSNFKNLYGRVSYRFNLERNDDSRRAIQAAGAMGPRDHTYLNLGTFYFYGRSVQRFAGADVNANSVILSAREPFYRTGGDFSFNYRTFNLFGVFMYGRDQNLLPIDNLGNVIPLPVTAGMPPIPVAFVHGTPESFTGGFVEADYLVLPWMMAIMRWDAVNSTADRINGLTGTPAGSFAVPYRSTRNRFSPAMQFLIHPNVKASFEYDYRPQQVVTYAVDPITGLPVATNPFRTNTLLIGLEFVY
jgi:hypothetical protein